MVVLRLDLSCNVAHFTPMRCVCRKVFLDTCTDLWSSPLRGTYTSVMLHLVDGDTGGFASTLADVTRRDSHQLQQIHPNLMKDCVWLNSPVN